MNKLFTLSILFFTLLTVKVQAQEPCLTEILYQEELQNNPDLAKSREELEIFTQNWIATHGGQGSRAAGMPYIIPVVFHIIHYGGGENITREQCLSQIDSLNKDLRYMNSDKVNTPAAFQSIAADCNVEFRMAQKDPNGNCTDGVTRTYSPLTYNARNNVKGLIHWPSNQYLNIYVVSSIITSNGVVVPGSFVAGFAQFPLSTSNPLTDGVVLRSDRVGNIGTAGSADRGRTATHEVGHWLNLRHIWGDQTCGSDSVSDTPTQEDSNLGLCPSWPHTSPCTGNGPNGDNFSNHMDYTDDACRNMFTMGQYARIDAALNSPVAGRNNLHTQTNLIATGTDGTPAVECGPRADFVPKPRFVCPGGSLTFKDLSWNGTVSSRMWTFQGGTPLNDTSANPVITYNNPGTYDVTLSASNSGGTDTKTVVGMVIVSDPNVTITVPYFEGFEFGTNFPNPDWYLNNTNGGNTWEVSAATAYTGSQCLRLVNFTNQDKGFDEFITPAFDFTNVAAPAMSFKNAFAFYNSTTGNDDKLVVSFSTDCGQTWTVRLTRQGTSLTTVPNVIPTSFVPTSQSQWDNQTVNITSLGGQPNVRFKFEFTHNFGNNLYLDDINITGTVDLDELNAEQSNVTIYPNPAENHSYISFSVSSESKVKLDMIDVSGRIINTNEYNVAEGENKFLLHHPEPGIYLVKLSFGKSSVTKKLVIR